jgi:hypothetical protein
MNFLFRPTFARFSQAAAASIVPPAVSQQQKQMLFRLTRTHTKNVPVYLSYTGGARRVPMTEVRRIEGNMEQAQNEIQRLVGSHVNVRRADGKLYVTGNFVTKIKKHLVALGF